MVTITIVVLVLKVKSRGVREWEPLRIAREIKSSIYVFSFIPFVVHFTHQMLSVSYSKDHSFFSILAIISGLALLCIYWNHFFRMAQGIRDINHLHSKAVYQSGKVRIEQGLDWAFDTYISMETNIPVRIIELFAYIIFAANYASGYVIGAFSASFSWIVYVFLLVANIQKMSKYVTGTNERDVQKKITMFSIVHLALITANHTIYLFFWLFSGMGLGATKFWTWVWYIFTFADLIVVCVQLGFRLYTMRIVPEHIKQLRESEERTNQIKEYKESQRAIINKDPNPVQRVEPVEDPEDAPINNRRTIIDQDHGDDNDSYDPNQNAGMQNRNPYANRQPVNAAPAPMQRDNHQAPNDPPVIPRDQQVYVEDPANFYEESIEDQEIAFVPTRTRRG